MSKKRIVIKWIIIALAIALNVFIIVNSCIPGAASSKESHQFTDVVKNVVNAFKPNTIVETNYNDFHALCRKLFGHFSLFLIDGVISTISIQDIIKNKKCDKILWQILIPLFFGLFVAALTEIIQLIVPGRAGMITDILIDFAGFVVGTFIVILIKFIIHHKKSKK